MSVKIRLKKFGRSNLSCYRMVAVDSRKPRDGKVLEELGFYDPSNKESSRQYKINVDRAKFWLDHGAIPSPTCSTLIKKSGLDHKQLCLPKAKKPKPKPVDPKAAAAPAEGATA